MDVDITNERGHGKGDDGDDKDETIHEIYCTMKRDSSK